MQEIQLSQYLNRIGLDQKELSDMSAVEALNAIYSKHVLTFPYSNVQLRQAGRKHPLERNLQYEDYKNVFYKPIGGYCFQLAALLKDILLKLNYNVESCEARVLMGAEVNSKQALLATHLVLKVTIDGDAYFLDPGMGSLAPRFPILVRNPNPAIIQPPDELKFYYLEQEKTYVLERKKEDGKWQRLLQTDLIPQTQAKIEYNLMRLEQQFPTFGIRDQMLVIGRVLPHGYCSIIWLEKENQLEYNNTDENVSEILSNYAYASRLILEKFDIEISPSELKQCCLSNKDENGLLFFAARPQKPWTVEEPILNEKSLSIMQNNLIF